MGIILCYHRIANASIDPWSLCVSPRRFEEQLTALQKHVRIVDLGAIIEDVENGRTSELSSVAITFDDGYADNLYNALPILMRHQVPVTLFVATGFIERGYPFWWDQLTELFFGPGALRGEILLFSGCSKLTWRLNSEDSRMAGLGGWRAWDEPRFERERVYYEMWSYLNNLNVKERFSAMASLIRQTNKARWEYSTRPLTIQEVRYLSRSNLVRIGAHTQTHPKLSSLLLNEQEAEIRKSRAFLESLLEGAVVDRFAYPFGDESSYGPETADLVRQAGFRLACAVKESPVKPHSNLFELPRITVENWGAGQLLDHINKVLAQ